jgi:hypothetical protein
VSQDSAAACRSKCLLLQCSTAVPLVLLKVAQLLHNCMYGVFIQECKHAWHVMQQLLSIEKGLACL